MRADRESQAEISGRRQRESKTRRRGSTRARGGKPADVTALRRLLVQVSSLAVRRPEIAEMDLNPVIVYEKGLLIADARVVLTPPSTPS